jgi:hypothetical protein
MAQAVSRRPLTAEVRVWSRVSPCGICGGQSGTGTGLCPSTAVSPCQFHSTGVPLQGKTKKKRLIIFITGLHNKPQGCGASVHLLRGPSLQKKTTKDDNCGLNNECTVTEAVYSQRTINQTFSTPWVSYTLFCVLVRGQSKDVKSTMMRE